MYAGVIVVDETPYGIRGVIVDLSEEKAAEEERRRMDAQLLYAQRLEAIGTLAGGVAHEINNPIMGIMNYSQMILDELAADSPVAEFAQNIYRETERVAAIIKKLLLFAQNEPPSYGPSRLCDIVESTLALVRTVLERDMISIDVDVPPDLPVLWCQSQQIQQVFMNLITNAHDALNAKYPAGDTNKKIVVKAFVVADFDCSCTKGAREGGASAQPEPNRAEAVRLQVEDSGPGIEECDLARLFDPFYTTKAPAKGTGLGLWASSCIVREHNGEICVMSKPGEWTRFCVNLPMNGKWDRKAHGELAERAGREEE
jgi:signal transduction histidine kinase